MKLNTLYALATLAIMGTGTALPTVAFADDAIEVSANVALASDYRFRGLSLSDKDIAIQGGLDLSHKSGFYVGTWASSIETFNGAETELDVYGGYVVDLGNDLALDVGFLAYLFPGGQATDYFEVYSSLSGSAGDLGWTVGGNYVWDGQSNLAGQDNIYLYVDASYPLADSGFSIDGHFAYEDGAFGDEKLDWNLGVTTTYKGIDFGLRYVDTDQNFQIAKAGVVFSVGASF